MLFRSLCLLAVALAIPKSFETLTPKNENGGVNWAVLVAGSNTYSNYRHQADVCHAYQVLKKNGFSDEYIIVMMYDDIAYNSQNPKPGKVYNVDNGPDVYAGVPKDYKGNAVTATNFYNVLQGFPTTGGSGKRILSSHNDNIFVFYSDHGSVGLICMPVGAYVYATDLNNVLKSMAAAGKFNKFLFYVEACESGSMFYNHLLPTNLKIFATTASTPYESSYACNYSPTMNAYLGDCYSVNWIGYTESVNVEQVSVEQEFEKVRSATTGSTVCAYGDTSLSYDTLSVYQEGRTNHTMASPQPFTPATGPVSQRVIEEGLLKEQYNAARTNEERAQIAIEMEKLAELRRDTHSFFFKFGLHTLGLKYEQKKADFLRFLPKLLDEHRSKVDVPQSACDVNALGELVFANFECYKTVTEMVRETCGPLDSYSLQFTPAFASLCELTQADIPAFRSSVEALCPSPIWQ